MKILATALLLGVTGDLLLRAMPLGINVPLWTLLLLAGVAFITRDPRAMLLGAIGALIASCGMAWRDSRPLTALDFLLLLMFYAFLSLRARGVREWATGITAAGAALVMSAFLSASGVFQLIFSEIKWSELRPGVAMRRTLVVLRGFLIAFPLLLIFIALLTSADPAFASIMRDLFNIDFPELIGHMLFTLLIAVPVAGYLHALITPRALPDVERPSWFHLAAAETNIAIGLIDILFAAFVAVQLRYFFGGAALVEVAPHLTYADYARRGFFELVAVVAIVIPTLLAAEWLIEIAGRKTFRILALAQVLLVFVILISAYRRMQLYVDNFGLTQLRLYTTAFMFLLAALLAWFAATVLTGHRERFFIGAVTSGLIVVLVLHAINPDALIVRTNVSHKRPLDIEYLTSLSADADPELVAAHLPCTKHRRVTGDWRSWNYSRDVADVGCTPAAPGPGRR